MKGIAAKIILLAALGLLAPGCATVVVSSQIWPGEEQDADHVFGVSAAYRGEAGEVLICLEGMPAGKSWWFGPVAYSIAFPAGAYAERSAEASDLRIFHHKALPVFDVTKNEIRGACPAPGSKAQAALTPLPLVTLNSERFGSRTFSGMPDEKLRTFFAVQAQRSALYTLLSRPYESADHETKDLVYLHEAPIFRGEPSVHIQTGLRDVEGQPLWALMFPLALAFDVVTSPIQLLFVLTYH